MAVVVFKQIRPDRFKDKAIFDEILKAMDKTGDDIKDDFEKTTATWERDVDFEVQVDFGPKGPAVLVGTDDRIYGFVSEGTRPHIILPKRAKKLRFKNTYTAKTVPGVIDSRQGGSSGKTVYSDGVIHPGTEARRFDEVIQKKWQSRFKRRMEKALRDGARKSGHSL